MILHGVLEAKHDRGFAPTVAWVVRHVVYVPDSSTTSRGLNFDAVADRSQRIEIRFCVCSSKYLSRRLRFRAAAMLVDL